MELEQRLIRNLPRNASGDKYIPRSRTGRIDELLILRHLHVYLPVFSRDRLTLDQQEQEKQSLGGLSFSQLREQILQERRRLREETVNQWPKDLPIQ